MPLWLIALVGLATAALLAQQFINLRQRLPLGQAAFLTFLRACVYAGLIFFLLGPALIDKRVTKLRRPLTLLIDTSQSMSFPASAKSAAGDKAAKSRLDLVKEKLEAGQEPLIQRLNRDYDLRVIRFGTGLEPIAPGSLERLRAQDPGTPFDRAAASAPRATARRSSGIVVFSDGITNGEMKSLDGGRHRRAGFHRRRRRNRRLYRRAHRQARRAGIRLSRP